MAPTQWKDLKRSWGVSNDHSSWYFMISGVRDSDGVIFAETGTVDRSDLWPADRARVEMDAEHRFFQWINAPLKPASMSVADYTASPEYISFASTVKGLSDANRP